jgi:hypothetical protein
MIRGRELRPQLADRALFGRMEQPGARSASGFSMKARRSRSGRGSSSPGSIATSWSYIRMSRSIVRGAHLGALRGRPQLSSMRSSLSFTCAGESSVRKPTTRLMKSSPANPTAGLRYAGENRECPNACSSSSSARARFFSGSTLLPAAT